MGLLLSFEFVDDTIQRFKALVPHLAVTRDPLQLLFETARAHAAGAHATYLFGGHEAGRLERADVFLHARERHFELVGEFGDGGVAASKLVEDATTGGVGEGGKGSVEACRRTLNHMVQCIVVCGGTQGMSRRRRRMSSNPPLPTKSLNRHQISEPIPGSLCPTPSRQVLPVRIGQQPRLRCRSWAR